MLREGGIGLHADREVAGRALRPRLGVRERREGVVGRIDLDDGKWRA
jgi:hypothetical protein